MFTKAVFALDARVWYSLGSNVNTQFFKISIPEFGHSAGALGSTRSGPMYSGTKVGNRSLCAHCFC